MTNTMAVVIAVSRRDGQVIFCASARTSCMNLNRFVLAMASSPEFGRGKMDDSQRRPSIPVVRVPSFVVFSCLAGVEGLEPPTPGFGDRCSSQLSYTPSQKQLRRPRGPPQPVNARSDPALQAWHGLSPAFVIPYRRPETGVPSRRRQE